MNGEWACYVTKLQKEHNKMIGNVKMRAIFQYFMLYKTQAHWKNVPTFMLNDIRLLLVRFAVKCERK